MALEICNRSVILNNGKITADDDTYKILKNEKIMSDNIAEYIKSSEFHSSK